MGGTNWSVKIHCDPGCTRSTLYKSMILEYIENGQSVFCGFPDFSVAHMFRFSIGISSLKARNTMVVALRRRPIYFGVWTIVQRLWRGIPDGTSWSLETLGHDGTWHGGFIHVLRGGIIIPVIQDLILVFGPRYPVIPWGMTSQNSSSPFEILSFITPHISRIKHSLAAKKDVFPTLLDVSRRDLLIPHFVAKMIISCVSFFQPNVLFFRYIENRKKNAKLDNEKRWAVILWYNGI